MEKRKAMVRAKVAHACFHVKRVSGYRKVRYRGLARDRNRRALLPGFANLTRTSAERGNRTN